MKNYYEAFISVAGQKISRPGEYQGYSEMKYDGFKRFSQYVTMRDGVKIAVDYYRPTMNGEVVETPLPVIWRFTPYGRIKYHEDGRTLKYTTAFTGDGIHERKLGDEKDNYCQGLSDSEPDTLHELMLKVFTAHGYIVAQADVRGKFASFGTLPCINPGQVEADDGYEINEWLATQPWCNGKTGMYGSSYTGQTQLEAIRTKPPHLKAAVVCMTDYDKYDGWVRGGIPRGGDAPMQVDDEINLAVPVDEDVDGSLLRAAIEQHRHNSKFTLPPDETTPPIEPQYTYNRLPYRDSFSTLTDNRYWVDTSASTYKDAINESGVAIYLIGGWFDVFRRDTLVTYNNLSGPRKMIVGPWFHTRPKLEVNLLIEHLRFYDFWLKDIENGVMDEHPIYYKTVNNEWQFEKEWPPANLYNKSLFLGEESLVDEAPSIEGESDQYMADYTITDLEESLFPKELETKGMTFTTEALSEDLVVTGHALANLWISSTGTDSDLFVFLIDVDEQGKSTTVTNGILRASMRQTEIPPYNFNGLPWHPCRKEDVQKLKPGIPVKMVIDFLPTSYMFKKGHRIRLAITTSLQRYFFHQEEPVPQITIYRNAIYPSYITLPLDKQ
ncbi:CocE/NonD family hydrolase [Neobacillus sp. 3P2-tot-E-2]|uniref:CocE/NonD family hydrolase n=1 Tax=Neobacillus sp. 3P2-tot-E-2 TaxID=3132212 RepID=UPI0039A07A52